MNFERDDYLPDHHTADLDRHEREEAAAEQEWQRKLYAFRADPYSYCEWNLDAFSKTDLLDIALNALLDRVDLEAATDYRNNQCAERDVIAAIEDSIWRVEL